MSCNSHNLLSKTISHCSFRLLKRMRLPRVLAARGKPLHLSDIFLPISSKSLRCLESLSENAIVLKIDQQSSLDNSSKLILFALPIMSATLFLRVVTRILLPWAAF
ncbi:hypothetical protein ACJW31_03G069700 [Castanea mollissima]